MDTTGLVLLSFALLMTYITYKYWMNMRPPRF